MSVLNRLLANSKVSSNTDQMDFLIAFFAVLKAGRLSPAEYSIGRKLKTGELSTPLKIINNWNRNDGFARKIGYEACSFNFRTKEIYD